MKKVKTISKPILLLILFAAITSFTTKLLFEHGSNKKNWIPDDFDPKKVTLLIEKHPSSERYNKAMGEYLEKNYPWKYEIATVEEIQTGTKYSDKMKYQFALVWNDKILGAPRVHVIENIDLEGHFLDRSISKEYPISSYGLNRGLSAYKKILSVLVKKCKGSMKDNI